MDKEPIVVQIAGKRYTLAEHEDRDHIQRIVDLTDRRIRETQIANPSLTREEAAVSAAMSMADDLVKCNQEIMRLKKRSKPAGASDKN